MIRSIRALLAWASAAVVALTLLRRILRGEVVVVSNHAAPVIRLVAIALVFLAGCVEKIRPAPAPGPGAEDMSQGAGSSTPAPAPTPTPAPTPAAEPEVAAPQDFPADLDDLALAGSYRKIRPRSLVRWFAPEIDPGGQASSGFIDEPEGSPAQGLALALKAHVERAVAGAPETAATLTALLVAAEAAHVYDAWLAAHLWQHARTLRPAPPQLLGRIERHLRVCHALLVAQTTTGPVEFSAWRSKAGPPRGWTGVTVPTGLAAAARDAYSKGVDADTWDSEAVLALTVAGGQPRLLRRGGESMLAVGAALRLRRLDVVRADAAVVLRHPELGALNLPAGAELTAWNVAEFLAADARARLQGRVDAALGGDAAALAELEAVLPAAHAAIRAAVTIKPNAPGAAALRLTLTTFDE